MAYKIGVKFLTNKICQICGQAYYDRGAGIHCPKSKAMICMKHCLDCQFLMRPEWRCIYRAENDIGRKINELYEKNGMERKNAMSKDTAFLKQK